MITVIAIIILIVIIIIIRRRRRRMMDKKERDFLSSLTCLTRKHVYKNDRGTLKV